MKQAKQTEAEKLYRDTDTPVKDIAEQLDLNVSTIYGWAKKHSWQNPNRERDFEAIKWQAQVRYVKGCQSADAIHKELNISLPTIQKWKNEGKWDELRPDIETLLQLRAADLYINTPSSVGDIAAKINVSKEQLFIWIHENGWHTSREFKQSPDPLKMVAVGIADHLKYYLKGNDTEISLAVADYLKQVKKSI
ncbi:MAG TPA: hypothetical protein VL442_12870 [Mucilaginibacter sp.]|jgi:uncharacterized protein YjcR|nr:hypothetical protein [Mucilaginibacter sp.]